MGEPSTPKKKSVEDFEYGECLGEGSYGSVYVCIDKATGRKFAAKKIEKSHLIKEKKTKYALLEKEIMSLCNHPNIIKLYYSFRGTESLYYIMELAPNSDLLENIKKHGKFNLKTTQFYAAEIVSALRYLHVKQGIVHRDLKPENILLSNDFHVKLTDFGTAKKLGKDKKARSNSFVGTAEYISPEALDPDLKLIYKTSDLWALGCIIYQMLTGKPPFKGTTQHLTFEKVLEGEVEFPEDMPPVAVDIITKLLNRDPEKRLGASGYKEIKKHPFFQDIDWKKLEKMDPPSMKPETV